MGITIHYKGKLNDEASINHLIDEVRDIAEIMHWKYDILDTDLPDKKTAEQKVDGNLYGIVFSPENCDPVWLTFLSNRKLCTVLNLHEFTKPLEEVDELNYWCFTKTQYAGPEVHKALITMLKHISEKYFEYIEVDDEGNYWETGDMQLLNATFKKYSVLIDAMGDALEFTQQKPGESIEEAIIRVFKGMHNRENKP
jgi:hypothetical protein